MKSDYDLAVELLFGAYTFREEEQKKKLGDRYEGVHQKAQKMLHNNAKLLTAIQMYLKKFGFDKLI